jgi:hypothetical protein
MCGKPKVVQQDPEGDARKAAEKATAEANLKKSMRRGTAGAASLLSPTSEEPTKGSGFAGNWKQFVNDKKSTLGGG